MAKKRYYEPYAGMDSRRSMEYEDSMMIKEDPNAPANLPQSPIIKMYPKVQYLNEVGLDDTATGIQRQMESDIRAKAIKKGPYPEKY